MSEDEDTTSPPTIHMPPPSIAPTPVDIILLQKVIDIASSSAESGTAVAAAMASARAENENMRLEVNGLTMKVSELSLNVNELVRLGQAELDHKRNIQDHQNKTRETHLEILKDTFSNVLTPQTVILLLTIIASAFGVSYNMSNSSGGDVRSLPYENRPPGDMIERESTGG